MNELLKKILKNKKIPERSSHGGEVYHLDKEDFDKIIDFSININVLANSMLVYNDFKNSFKLIGCYPDSGSNDLTNSLIKYLSKISSQTISKENIVVGSGAMDIISTFFELVINPDDEVIIIEPTFSEYRWCIERNSGKIIEILRKAENNFRINPKSILDLLTEKTQVVVICNPNNPNGLLEDKNDMIQLIQQLNERNIVLFLDSSFIDFTDDDGFYEHEIHNYQNLFICRNFTKFFGIPGLRVGYAISSPELLKYFKKYQKPWSVNCVGQTFADFLLKVPNFKEKTLQYYKNEYKFFKKQLSQINGLKVYPSNTNFVLINTEETGLTAKKIKEFLLKRNILIRDCSNYIGLNDYYMRVSIRKHSENLHFLKEFSEIISNFSRRIK